MKIELNGCYKMKINYKAFVTPILTAIISNVIKGDAVRIGIANALILWQLLNSIFNLFPYIVDL